MLYFLGSLDCLLTVGEQRLSMKFEGIGRI